MNPIKKLIPLFIAVFMMYGCSSPKLGKDRLDLEKFDLNFDVAAFYADEIEKAEKNIKESEKILEKRDKEKLSEKEKEALTEKIWELLDFRVIQKDTVLSGEIYEDDRKPMACRYDMRSWRTRDSLAYFQKMHFYKINMATSLNGDFIALVTESESKGTDDFEALLHYLEQKHGKATVKEDSFYNGSFTYHWELDDRLLAIFSRYDNKENTLKLGIEVTEDGVKADTTKQPTHVTRLFILKNQYKQDSILRCFTRGDWISFNDLLNGRSLPKKNDWDVMNLSGKVKKIHYTYNQTDCDSGSTYFFDKKGFIEKIIDIDEQGKEEPTTFAYEFDNKGNRTKEYVYKFGKLIQYAIYLYDENGCKKEAKEYSPDSELLKHTQYKYDKKGKSLECKTYDYIENQEIHHKYVFDEKGNEIMLFTEGIESSTFTYKYDNQGNWIEKTIFLHGKINLIIKREIEYY